MTLSSKDISLSDGEDAYFFRYLDWDSNFFKRPCYIFDVASSHITNFAKFANVNTTELDGAFVTAKIASCDCNLVQAFQKCGFRYIDTEITLELDEILDGTNNNIEVIKPTTNKNLPYENLGSVFSLTRFHSDPHISADQANLIWVSYLKNYIIDDSHYMYVALFKSEVVGVVLVNIEKPLAMINYVAVLSPFQKSGVGTKMIQQVVRSFEDFTIRTETQVKNLKALNFYIRNGLKKIYSTYTVMHRW